MDLTLTNEQRLLCDSADRLIAAEYPLERSRRIADETGFDRAFWRRMAEMGWLGACLPETVGGYAASAQEPLILMGAMGRGLVVEPLLHGLIAPAQAIFAAAPDRAEALLAPAIAGEEVLALAWAEAERRYDLAPAATRAERDGAGWRLSGRKMAVVAAPEAGRLVVSAQVEGGTALFLVAGDAAGMTAMEHRMIDGQAAADLLFADLRLPEEALLAGPDTAPAALEAAFDHGAAGACAAAVGCMEAVLGLTLDYARTRQQFGRRISEFQVVQHRLAAMSVELEYARSMLLLLVARLDGPADARRLAVSAARAKIGPAARHVVAEGIQLHGGIGVTDDLAVSHHFRKVQALEYAFGDTRWHLERYRVNRKRGYDLVAA